MLEQLKNLAMQKLSQKMLGNALNSEATSEAASEGANALLESLKGGDISQITALFGGSGEGSEVASNIQTKLKSILESKGMSSEEAEAESASTATDLISGLKEKFQSTDEADKDFDLSNITSLLGGNAGNILNTAKKLFS